MDINISLEQGKQFKKLQKNIATKTKIKEAYSNNYLNTVVNNETKQFVSLQKKTKEGFDNINNTNTNTTPNITKPILTTPDVVEIQTLEQQYNSLIQQLSVKQQSILEEDRNYIDRTDKNQNKFLNNNIQLTDGSKGYVNNSGVVKWYGTEDVFNNTAGKNGCPSNNNMMSVNFAQNAEYQNPGASIPVDPALKVGTYMLNGQGCGNEGKNVYVSKMINSNKSSHIGCYNNTDGKAMTKTDLTNSTFEKCKQYAINNAYKLFGLGDFDTSNQTSTCYVGNDKTTATQYGNVTFTNTPVAIWSTNTNGKGVSFLNISTEGSIQLCATDGSIIYETTKDKTCTKSYSISNKTDAKGNDIKKLSGTTLDNCKKTCYDNPQCAGFAMNNSTNSECWIKSNVSKSSKKSNRDLYTKLPTKSNIANCIFFLTLQSDGNLCIYRGNSPQNNKGGGAVWCSMTNGKQQAVNNNWIATKGKYGKSFLTSGQTLALGEWIGSDDGKMRLILQQDGNLVLYTSTNIPVCIKDAKDNMIYGSQGILSVYELEASGIKDNMGKLGYVNDNSDLREYPASMIGISNDYTTYKNMNLVGQNPLVTSNTTNVEDCQQQCNNNNDCKAYTFQQGSNVCYQYGDINKSTTIMPTDGITFGERKPKLLNDASCSLDYTEIDTNQWQNYNKGEKMLSTTKCGYGLIRENTYQEMLDIQLNMLDVANKIVDKLNTIITNTNNTINQGTDMNWANEQLTKYKQIQNSLANLQQKPTIVSSKQEGFLNMTDINGMLSDSNINVLAANYNYILWSIFALGLVTITLKHINK